MNNEFEIDPTFDYETSTNEYTGAKRESLLPPGPNEPVCLISYEITFILLAGGPDCRSSFWKSYRRELALNKKTDYHNYHISVCSTQLVSLKMQLNHPIYFRNNRLTTEKQLDPYTLQALTNPRFH